MSDPIPPPPPHPTALPSASVFSSYTDSHVARLFGVFPPPPPPFLFRLFVVFFFLPFFLPLPLFIVVLASILPVTREITLDLPYQQPLDSPGLPFQNVIAGLRTS